MFSIICAYNNKKMLEDCVIKSLKKQKNIEYETIFVNAEEHHFSSASETLNYGGQQAKGDYLIFLHQDIIFETEDVLEKIKFYCDHYQFGIAGVAGVTVIGNRNRLITQIEDGKDHTAAGTELTIHHYNNPQKVFSLDECMFIIPNNVFKLFQFSDLGKTWHLYATDYSCKCMKNGFDVLVLPLKNIWHLSDGRSFSIDYFFAVSKLIQLYRKNFKMIYTVYGRWPTLPIVSNLKVLYREIRYKILKK